MKAALVLADGNCFRGELFGASGKRVGQVVFNTSMGGYGEIFSDPVSLGQIVVMTYPLIGNYGINRDELQSDKIYCQGLVLKEGTTQPSSWLLEDTLENFLKEAGVPAITGVDTRALTRHLRKNGSMLGMITTEGEADPNWYNGQDQHPFDITAEVTTLQPYTKGEGEHHVVVVDLGLRKSLLDALVNHNCRITVVPAQTPVEDILKYDPQGLVISSGPEILEKIKTISQNLKPAMTQIPTMGIGLGMEVIAAAFGAGLKKMKLGHRGANYPVKNLINGEIRITSQNHGLVVDKEGLKETGLIITEENLHDKTIEGIRHGQYPIFAVQYYPFSSAFLEGEESFYSRFIGTFKK